MVRILVKEKQSTIHVSLVSNCNPYSIEYHNDIIHLNSGWNELDELPFILKNYYHLIIEKLK